MSQRLILSLALLLSVMFAGNSVIGSQAAWGAQLAAPNAAAHFAVVFKPNRRAITLGWTLL